MNEDKHNYKYRLDLNYYEFEILEKHMSALEKLYKEKYNQFKDDNTLKEFYENDLISLNEIKEKINKPKKIKRSDNKIYASYKATQARTKKAKEKIQNAINILRMQDKKLTHYSIAKEANVSYLTVKKYISLDEM